MFAIFCSRVLICALLSWTTLSFATVGIKEGTKLTIFSETDPKHIVLKTTNANEIRQKLKEIGIIYEVWPIDENISAQSSHEQILTAYAPLIQNLISKVGYQSYDVIALNPDHPNKDVLRKKFLSEHTHAEDEVRFFVAGSGLFTVHESGYVYNILCVQGDFLNVPANIRHWFDMGKEPHFVVIRFFNNASGWVANYTGSDISEKFPRKR
jgi:1,2-dihydroxy-3-keto-5-methylthiopentene dioxygenase